MDFAALAAARYSLRKFDPRPVEPEKLALILEAGRNAPTAHNNQPQRILMSSWSLKAPAFVCTFLLQPTYHKHTHMHIISAQGDQCARIFVFVFLALWCWGKNPEPCTC